MRSRPVRTDLVQTVRWSTRHALADTIVNLGARFNCALLETLIDIDDAAALNRWLAGRDNGPQPHQSVVRKLPRQISGSDFAP